MKDAGEPESSKALQDSCEVAAGPLCSLTRVVNEALSIKSVPPTKSEPCSGIGEGREEVDVEAT